MMVGVWFLWYSIGCHYLILICNLGSVKIAATCLKGLVTFAWNLQDALALPGSLNNQTRKTQRELNHRACQFK